MGLISRSFPFLLGAGFGVFIAQNYSIPNIKQLIDEWKHKAERVERDYRKPGKPQD